MIEYLYPHYQRFLSENVKLRNNHENFSDEIFNLFSDMEEFEILLKEFYDEKCKIFPLKYLWHELSFSKRYELLDELLEGLYYEANNYKLLLSAINLIGTNIVINEDKFKHAQSEIINDGLKYYGHPQSPIIDKKPILFFKHPEFKTIKNFSEIPYFLYL